jgi:hypothetical protein
MSKDTIISHKRQLEGDLQLLLQRLDEKKRRIAEERKPIEEKYEILAHTIRQQPTDPLKKIPAMEEQIRSLRSKIASNELIFQAHNPVSISTNEKRINNVRQRISNLQKNINSYNVRQQELYKKMPLQAHVDVASIASPTPAVNNSKKGIINTLTNSLKKLKFGGRRHRRCKTVRRVRRSRKTVRKHSRR